MNKSGVDIQSLNAAQKSAVNKIDGPLIVIAGPGTGKTQLLSSRAANIVSKTDASPNNILCLTYTDAASTEMRNRLQQIMGPTGGDVSVFTFHSFGKWIIDNFPDYFSEEKILQNVDDITKKQIINSVLESLPFRHKLRKKFDDEFANSNNLDKLITAIKQSGMTINEIKLVSAENKKVAANLNNLTEEIFSEKLNIKNMPAIEKLVNAYAASMSDASLNKIIISQLKESIDDCYDINKTGPLGKWRDKHTEKKHNQRVLKTFNRQSIIDDALVLYEKYQEILHSKGLYDYGDMINWAAQALKDNRDLLMDVAERFQYVMVDEYQDTNGAQNALLDAILTANPINEPNVMVVGDDDQAIMHFQGAEYSGMLKFIKKYNPELIILEDNYRSSETILKLSREVITATDDRLENILSDIKLSKELIANKKNIKSRIQHLRYETPIIQYISVANHIKNLVDKEGVKPSEISVICSKHKELVNFSNYLSAKQVKFSYRKMENVLEDAHIEHLLNLAEYICLLSEENPKADNMLAKVLSAEYFEFKPLDHYRIAAEARSKKTKWLEIMLSSSNTYWKNTAEMLVALSVLAKTTDFTNMIDYLIGRQKIENTDINYSPYKKYLKEDDAKRYVRILSHLIKLRNKVLEYNPKARKLRDFLDAAAEYRNNNIEIFNDSPLLSGSVDGVQLLSAHQSKGKEFQQVIILSAVDEIWGKKARKNYNKIYLPENLPLYTESSSESDLIRLIYVAITRAKEHLLLASYRTNESGKAMNNLSLISHEDDSLLAPKDIEDNIEDIIEAVETTWNLHTNFDKTSLHTILKPYIESYRLSPSALQSFVDVRYNGPQAFIEKSLLKFPSAYTENTALGSAAHSAIEFAYRKYKNGKKASEAELIEKLDYELQRLGLSDSELTSITKQAHKVVPAFIDQFSKTDFDKIIDTEKTINTTVKDSGVSITGKLDAIQQYPDYLKIIDYKTGEPPIYGWKSSSYNENKKVALHFNEMQLYFYKVLVEDSRLFDKPVKSAELIFVESIEQDPDNIVRLAIDDFEINKINHVKALIKAVRNILDSGDYPDISKYPDNKKGIEQFEKDLVE